MTLLLSYNEGKLIRKIILGCERFVCSTEEQRLDRRFKPRKPSQSQLALLSVVFPSLSDNYTDEGFRPFPTVKKRLEDVETVEKAIVYNSLRSLINVNYLQKTTLKKHSREYSAKNTVYFQTQYFNTLKELVAHVIPRSVIYYKLLESNVLLRYLSILIYCKLLERKHIDVAKTLKVRRARGIIDEEKKLEDFKDQYMDDKDFLKDKTNREILFNAQRYAINDLKNRPPNSPLYTRFFIVGGICYGEIELEPYRQ